VCKYIFVRVGRFNIHVYISRNLIAFVIEIIKICSPLVVIFSRMSDIYTMRYAYNICYFIVSTIKKIADKANYYSYDNTYISDKPTTPTIFYVLCKTTSAVVLWKSEFNGGSTQEFYVQHSRKSQSSSSMLSPSIPDSGPTSEMQYTVNSLVPETIYIFQIIARNNDGDSSSTLMTCTTDQSMYVLI
jgi:hypothetical protein